MRYYKFEGYPYLNAQGIPFVVGAPGQGGKRVWPDSLEARRANADIAIVDQTAVNHPSPEAGRGWARVISNADIDAPGFLEVAANSADGEIIHRIWGEAHGRHNGGICHAVTRLQNTVTAAQKQKEATEIVIEKITNDMEAISDAGVSLEVVHELMGAAKDKFTEDAADAATVLEETTPLLEQATVDMDALISERESKRNG